MKKILIKSNTIYKFLKFQIYFTYTEKNLNNPNLLEFEYYRRRDTKITPTKL